MIQNYAIIRDGVVVNVCVWDGVTTWQPPQGCIVVPINSSRAGIDWTYAEDTFTAPAD